MTPPEILDPARVVVETHAEIRSTQERMSERIRAGEDVHAHVVRAERQLAGAGTRGRVWASDRGGSYQTVAVRGDAGPAIRPLIAAGVTVAIGVGIAEVLNRADAEVGVKWPNDLWLRQRKLGGILSEAYRGWLLVGVGINVANQPPPGGTGLYDWQVDRVHEMVIEGVAAGLDLWASGTDLRERFARVDAMRGRALTVRSGQRTIDGIARGVDADGALLLGDERVIDGTVMAIASPPAQDASQSP